MVLRRISENGLHARTEDPSIEIDYTSSEASISIQSANIPPPRNLEGKSNDKGIVYSLDELKQSFIIPLVDNETIEDLVGVILTGLRLKLSNFKGDVATVFSFKFSYNKPPK